MDPHRSFLRAVTEDPDDDTPRLVYADYLEENGDPERAELIRLQCAMTLHAPYQDSSECRCESCREGRRREMQLTKEHGDRWFEGITGFSRRLPWRSWFVFRRGFPEFRHIEYRPPSPDQLERNSAAEVQASARRVLSEAQRGMTPNERRRFARVRRALEGHLDG